MKFGARFAIALIGDATLADAILDRLLQHHHRFTLTGDSLRSKTPAST
jgi:DNA replication protein DnaC